MSRWYAHSVSYVALCLAVTLAGCSSESKQGKVAAPPAVTGVSLQKVTVSDLPEQLDVVGTVRARTSAVVSARVAGTVSILHVREGDRVRKGPVLGKLDSQENVAQANSAAAAVDDARRGVDEAIARRKLADATYGRFKRLYDEQALTRQEFETRQTERDLAHQAVARAEARLRQVQESSRAAGTIADYTRLVAPVSGIVTAKPVALGATVFPGQQLMTIEDEGTYMLELAIPESYSRVVKAGSVIQAQVDAVGRQFSGRITEVVPASDPGSHTYVARIPLSGKGVRSGQFGRGTITLSATVKGVKVPKQAVFERGALTAVWAVGADEIIRMRIVKTGRTSGNTIEVLSGLADGDRIVTVGMDKAVDGGRLTSATPPAEKK